MRAANRRACEHDRASGRFRVGPLQVSMPGQLECALTAATGCEPRDVKLQWSSQASASWGLLQPDAALAGSWPMLPGEYELTIWGEGFVAVERHITVLAPPAATTRVEATLEPGQRLPLALVLPAGETRATFVVESLVPTERPLRFDLRPVH